MTQPNIPAPKDFQQQEPVLESYYNPHIYLLRGWGLLWYTALTRAQIHTNALDICDKRQVPRTVGALSDILLVALT